MPGNSRDTPMTQLLTTRTEPATIGVLAGWRLRNPAATRVLVGLSIAHAAALPLWPNALTIGLLLWWNANTISHYFLHRPFFLGARQNAAFSLWLSALLFLPQSMWRDRHLAHHAERPPRVRRSPQFLCEAALVVAVWGTALVAAPAWFFTALAPGVLLGLAICAVHGHYEHAPGTTSHYGRLYNRLFFNDGFHVEHHRHPNADWRSLPGHRQGGARGSAWPAVLRFCDLEQLERSILHRPALQRFVLDRHRRAWRRLLAFFHEPGRIRRVGIVGGGLFPRTALLLRELLPDAELTIIDGDAANLSLARDRIGADARYEHAWFDVGRHDGFDLLVFPLAYRGDDKVALRADLPAPHVVFHEWLHRPAGASAVVCPLLWKRMNLHTGHGAR
jgi:hypothetical protein